MPDQQTIDRPKNRVGIRLLTMASIVASALAIDQIVKFVMVEFVMQPPRIIEVTSFFDLVLVFNSGISFGMFSGQIGLYPVVFALVKTAIATALIVWGCMTNSRRERLALAVMAGGAAGNIVDRFRDGAVTDYLSLHAGAWAWPSFNLADVFVVTGAIALVACSMVKPRPKADI